MIKRPLAIFGLVFMPVQAALILLPQNIIFICMATLALAFVACTIARLKQRAIFLIVLLSVAAGLLYNSLYTSVYLRPLQALSGNTYTVTATIKHVANGFNANNVNAKVTVTHMQGQNYTHTGDFLAAMNIEPVSVGDVITFDAKLDSVDKSLGKYYYTDGVFVHFSNVQNMKYSGESADIFYTASKVQKYLSGTIISHFAGEGGAVIAAMALGDTSYLTEELHQNFVKSGLAHVLVVSGMHIGIVAGFIYGAMQSFLSARQAALIALLASIAFVFIVGFTPSSMRALIVLILCYGAVLLKRQRDILTSLGVAALIICLLNPYAAVDVSTLLSFSATAGVLIAQSAIKSNKTLYYRHIIKVPALSFTLETAAISLGATIATAPILAAFGIGISLVSVITNVLVALFVPIITVFGMAMALLGNLPYIAFVVNVLGFVALISARAVIYVANLFGQMQHTVVHVSAFSAIACMFSAVALYFIGVKSGIRRINAGTLCVLFIVICMVLYGALSKNVVRIVAAGDTTNTPLVVMQGLKTAVIFRGTQGNVDDVQEILELYNRQGVDVAVDLRKTHDSGETLQNFAPKRVIIAQELTNGLTINAFDDVYLKVGHQIDGNYAGIFTEHFSVAVVHGGVDFNAYGEHDYYAIGSVEADNIGQGKLWISANVPAWAQNLPDEAHIQTQNILLLNTDGNNIKWGETQIDYN